MQCCNMKKMQVQLTTVKSAKETGTLDVHYSNARRFWEYSGFSFWEYSFFCLGN